MRESLMSTVGFARFVWTTVARFQNTHDTTYDRPFQERDYVLLAITTTPDLFNCLSKKTDPSWGRRDDNGILQ